VGFRVQGSGFRIPCTRANIETQIYHTCLHTHKTHARARAHTHTHTQGLLTLAKPLVDGPSQLEELDLKHNSLGPLGISKKSGKYQ